MATTATFADRVAEAVDPQAHPARARARSAPRAASRRAARRPAPEPGSAADAVARFCRGLVDAGRAVHRGGEAPARVLRGARRRRSVGLRGRLRLCPRRRPGRHRRREAGRHRLDGPRVRRRVPRAHGGRPVDALTVNPYLGSDSIEPFLGACRRCGTGIFCLVKTSNAGSADIQDVASRTGGRSGSTWPSSSRNGGRISSETAACRAWAPSSGRPTRGPWARPGGSCRRRSSSCPGSGRRARGPRRRARLHERPASALVPVSARSSPRFPRRRSGLAQGGRGRSARLRAEVWAVSGW